MELFQSWRKYDVIKREWVFQLEDQFAKVKDKYVYLRMEGIRKLLHVVRSLNEQDEISVFLKLQHHKETNIALHILAFVLQNLPIAYLDQVLKPLPKVSLKDEITPAPTPRPSSVASKHSTGTTSSTGTGTCNSVVIKGSALGSTSDTYKDNTGTYNSVVINTSSDSLPNTGTYNSVVFNEDDSEESDTDYNTIAYNATIPSSTPVRPPSVTLRRSTGGTTTYANPSTTEERALALELIQGVCLIHPGSKTYLFESGILPLLILLLDVKDDSLALAAANGTSSSPRGARNLSYSHSAPVLGRALDRQGEAKKESNYPRKQEIMATLDALLCVLVDHEPLQKEFVDLRGVESCVRVLKTPFFGRGVRAKCVVFLVYLVRYFPIGHTVKLLLLDAFGEQLVNVLMRSVRLGQQSDSQTVPGESFLDAFDKSVESVSLNK